MPITRRSGGTNVTTPTKMRRSGGANVAWTIAKRRVSGAWVDVLSNAHTVDPDDYFASVPNGSHQAAIGSNVIGGTGPFTYSWTWAGGGTGMTISNATSPSCTITSTGTNVYRSGILRCTVIDTGNGNLSKFGDGTIDIQHGTPV